MITDLLAYVGLGCVLVGYMMNNMIALRVLAILGSSMFLVQAIIIDQRSLVITNTLFIMVNIFMLANLLIKKLTVDFKIEE